MIEAGQLILALALGGAALAVLITAPGLAHALKPFAQKKHYPLRQKDLKKVTEKIKKDKLVRIVEKNNRDYLEITNRGRRQLVEYNIDTVKIQKQKWDGLWRIVVFDIPEKYRFARVDLREKLREIGFRKLQKSVWICPYQCEKEISFIASVYGVEKYVNYIEAIRIDSDKYFRNIFNL